MTRSVSHNLYQSPITLSLSEDLAPRLLTFEFSLDSHSIFSQPRSSGGVGLLDPLKQQQALQWYWVCPLLLHYLGSPLVAKYSSLTFSHFLYYLFFPTSRCRIWFPQRPLHHLSYLNPLINLQPCISTFQHHTMFDTCYIDTITCLTLPFYDILLQSVPTDHPFFSSFIHPDLVLQSYLSAKKLLVSDVFYFDSTSQVLCVRSSFRQFTRHLTVFKSVAMLVSSYQLRFKSFFYNNVPSPLVYP